MNYSAIKKCDIANGTGVRVVLFVSGCSHHCEECHNQITWDENAGQPFTDETKKEIFDELDKEYIAGITFSGGDPLYGSNLDDVLLLIKEIKEKYKEKNIWLYTGYTFEAIMNGENEKRKEIIKSIDVLVDGPFIKKLYSIMLLWKGSSNQRVIDMQKTISENKIILYA